MYSDKELDNCKFTVISQKNRHFNESNYDVCKYKTLGHTDLFSLHIERPSYVTYSSLINERKFSKQYLYRNYYTICYTLTMCIMLTIFEVSIEEYLNKK